MIVKILNDDIKQMINSKEFIICDNLESFDNVSNNRRIVENGICLLNKDDDILNLYRCDNIEETKSTFLKVVSVCELGEEEIGKLDKIRYIVKGFLEICFRKKISVFLLSIAFIYMNVIGIKEKFYIFNLMYTWGFFKITETGKAIRFIKETIEQYRMLEESLVDKEFMNFFNEAIDDEVDDVKMYLRLDKTLQN
jgi:rubrerythrin